MSVLPGGRVVHCDGNKCRSTAALPVALRSTLGDTYREAEPVSITGWLFAGTQERTKHFCPLCISRYLPQALDGSFGPSSENLLAETGERR